MYFKERCLTYIEQFNTLKCFVGYRLIAWISVLTLRIYNGISVQDQVSQDCNKKHV